MTRYIAPNYRGKPGHRHGVNVIDHQDGDRLLCCWSDCDQLGTTLHRARVYLGAHPEHGGPIYTWYVFCTERHKMYWVNAPRDLNNLPPGYRLAVT